MVQCRGFKPLKSEAIHETGLSGNVVASFFPLIIFIIYIYYISYSQNARINRETYLIKHNNHRQQQKIPQAFCIGRLQTKED